MRRKISRRNHFYTASPVTIEVLLVLLSSVFLGACSDEARSAGGPIAVEISRRSRPQASSAVIVANRRLTGSEKQTGMVYVKDCDNTEYSGRIGLGTPMQEFNVVLDTGSYTLWVTSTACSEGCDTGNKYDSSASTTYEPEGGIFSQYYEDGSGAEGIISMDNLSVGGLTTKVNFGEVTKQSLEGCMPVDGIMGMGLSSSGDSKNAFETFFDAGVVDVPIFSFFMGNIDTDTPTGVLTLGGVNQTHYEDCLRWVSISNLRVDGYWSVDLKSLKLGERSVISNEATTILDTGSSVIIGPYDDVGYLADLLGAWCARFVGSYSSNIAEVDCVLDSADVEIIFMPCNSEFENVTIQLGWQEFTLTASELLLPLTDFGVPYSSTATDPWCMFEMMGHDNDWWILGDTFLRTFYTAYDVKEQKVGLAKATANRVGEMCDDDILISVDAGDSGDIVEPAPITPTPSIDDSSSSGATSTALQAVPATPKAGSTSTTSGDSTSSTSLDNTEEGRPVRTQAESSEEGEDEEPRGTVVVAAISSLLTLIVLITCSGVGLLVHGRIRRGTTHRHTQLGVSGKAEGGVEMTGNGFEATVVSDADDFVQAHPVSYRGSDSGSHRYRIAAETVAPNSGRAASGVTVMRNRDGIVVDDEEEEEEDDEVVEVDFGVSNTAGSVTPTGRMGRMFGGRGGAAVVTVRGNHDGVVVGDDEGVEVDFGVSNTAGSVTPTGRMGRMFGGRGGAAVVTVRGNHDGVVVGDDEGVEVDFGVSNEADSVTPPGRLRRMFGRWGGAALGFTAFRDREESSGQKQPGGQTHFV